MSSKPISPLTRLLSRRSESCPVCQCARRKQAGLAFWLVKTFESVCPFCRAYEKVHGRKSHQAVPEPNLAPPTAHSAPAK